MALLGALVDDVDIAGLAQLDAVALAALDGGGRHLAEGAQLNACGHAQRPRDASNRLPLVAAHLTRAVHCRIARLAVGLCTV